MAKPTNEATTTDLVKINRALISVSDKAGILEFARTLSSLGVEILSTGGTSAVLREAGITVRDISDLTGFPEMLDGRVKTLHPKVHGGLLARRDEPSHVAAMEEHEISPIDLVCVNLYPFEETVSAGDATLDEATEQIDIGGPAMIRSAAKNWRHVAVVTTPYLYDRLTQELTDNNGALTGETRRQLAQLAFMRTAFYDTAVFGYLQSLPDAEDADEVFVEAAVAMTEELETHMARLGFDDEEDEFSLEDEFDDDEVADGSEWAIGNGHAEPDGAFFPDFETIDGLKSDDLRYGENPHQQAAIYFTGEDPENPDGIAGARLLHGKAMSFNNYVDADAAWNLVDEFDEPACAIIKHTNPAGVAIGGTLEEAYRKALATDPVSAFGGVIAFNFPVDAATAQAVSEIFTEVIVAPEFKASAMEILTAKKNLRLLEIDADSVPAEVEIKHISGGMLIQTVDDLDVDPDGLRIVTERKPTGEELESLLFAWTVCKHVKSNAIVYARGDQTVGVGAGQMSRVDSVKLGGMRAQLPIAGTVLASDAFFPFRDGIDEAAKFGITAVIQPGGSVRDDEVIAAANEHGLAMVFTGIRHFKH
ncbi:MAG: bifunctional phosphoribosylaminoimidazolecarboxamide formyltransferase/IMP cyclohydrolase [Pyrinomonadaceae bacterium]